MNRNYNVCPSTTFCCPCPSPCPPVCRGPTGPQGVTGPTGQSAFEAAQQGGFTGTEAEFNAALATISQTILSTTIRTNEVLTLAQYQTLLALGEIDPNTAYDIIEDVP
jgi:hypothetical protein